MSTDGLIVLDEGVKSTALGALGGDSNGQRLMTRWKQNLPVSTIGLHLMPSWRVSQALPFAFSLKE